MRRDRHQRSRPGAVVKVHRLEENLGAVDVSLSAAEVKDIDAAASEIKLVGDRYAEANARLIDR